MIVDCHTHVMWYPDHVGERFAQETIFSLGLTQKSRASRSGTQRAANPSQKTASTAF
jgi:hypothetical protein